MGEYAGISDHMRDAHTPAKPEPAAPAVPQWPIRGVRVDGDTVVVSVIGGNDAARWLCGELVALISNSSAKEQPK